MPMRVWCRVCGEEFEADAAAIRSGAWAVCPGCRTAAPPKPPAAEAPSETATCLGDG